MSDPSTYIAYISYRHIPLDMKAAKKIQKKIENYTIPEQFREQFGADKFGHVFRDEDELPSTASLSDSFRNAIDRSKYLIVVCTPDLPKSKWCEEEIKYFLETHDRNNLLAVLVDGEPETSFSPYMLHDFDENGNPIADYEPLAANINGPGRTLKKRLFNKEITRLFATFIGCPFASLWDREKLREKNRILAFFTVAMVILCAFLGVVLNRNARINEQNKTIEEQNIELQSRLSTAYVESAIAKLENHDIAGSLEDALASLKNEDPAIYDHRVGKLLYDALGANNNEKMRSAIAYSQSANITQLRIADDKKHLILFDETGVIRCLSLETYDVIWDAQTNAKSATVYTKNLGERVIYKTSERTVCLSLTDGDVIWEYRSKNRDYFQALSEDGTLFAVADEAENRDAAKIVIINTADGSIHGQIDLSEKDGFTPLNYGSYHTYENAAVFSPDNSRFAFSFYEKKTGEETGMLCYWYVNLDTYEKQLMDTIEDDHGYEFYGADINSADDTVFLACHRGKSIRTTLYSKNGEHFESKEERVTHVFREKGGFYIDLKTDEFLRNDCRFLSNQGQIYIISDNQFFIFGRDDNTLYNTFSCTGSIINAYWANPENDILEVITDDGYIADYYMDYTEGRISGWETNQLDMDNMLSACNTGSGAVSENGTIYTVSSKSPGKLFFVSAESDPNRVTLIPSKTGDNNADTDFDFIVTDYSETGFIFNEDNSVSSFNKKSGEILKTANFGKDLRNNNIIILDEDHFLVAGSVFFSKTSFLYEMDNVLYSMDNTVENYPKVLSPSKPENVIRTYDGKILAWGEGYPFGYELDPKWKSNGFPVSSLSSLNFWLDGTMVKSLSDPENTLLYYSDLDDYPITIAGENGLILRYGTIVDRPEEETFVKREEKELVFIDPINENVTIMRNSYPSSGSFEPAFAHISKTCAAAYEDGTVCIYDIDRETTQSLENKYRSHEIKSVCFSDNDASLLVLTNFGRLDIYDTDSLEIVFSKQTDFLNKNSFSPVAPSLKASTSQDGNTLFVSYGAEYDYETACIIIDSAGWEEIAEFSGDSIIFDKDTGRVFQKSNEDIKSTSIVTYPLYDIQTLKNWAEKVVGGSFPK